MSKIFVTFIIFLNCHRAIVVENNFLENQSYNGFLTRDIFQIVIEIPYSIEKKSILQLRKQCLKDSLEKSYLLILDFINKERKQQKKNTIKNELFKTKYNWFLKKMTLFMEDYSKKESCKFIYRVSGKNLFEKVMN